MIRENVSEDDLLRWLNSRLHENGDFSKCRFESISRLAEKDKDGCNWYEAGLHCSGVPVLSCAKDAESIVAEAKKRFNVI